MDNLPSAAVANTQLEPTASHSMAASNASRELSLWHALRKHWVGALAITAIVFTLNAVYTLTRTPVYQSSFLILLDTDKGKVSISLADVASVVSGSRPGQTNFYTEIEVFKSGPLVRRALRQLDPKYQGLTADEVIRNLGIEQLEKADVLSVAYSDSDPERAKAVLEALAQTYVKFSFERKISQATSGIEFIQSKLPDARRKLTTSADSLRRFKERYKMIDPKLVATEISSRQRLLLQSERKILEEISGNQNAIQDLNKQLEQAGFASQTALPDAIIGQDETYQRLATELNEFEVEYTRERLLLQDQHPRLQELTERRDELRNLLQQRSNRILSDQSSTLAARSIVPGLTVRTLIEARSQAQARLAAATAQLQGQRQAVLELERAVQQVPRLQRAYTDLVRQYEFNAKVVDRFAEKLQELRITEAQETAPWRILEPPFRPQIPVKPNIPRNLLLGLIVGGLFGVVAALLLERADDSIQDADEAKKLTGLPVLARVPKLEASALQTYDAAEEAHYALGQGQSFVAFEEAISALALSLRYLGTDGKFKVLALTSSLPGEGKSTVTYYLGESLANQGRKILVIDADMRRPTLHQRLEVPNSMGLSTAIATETPWQEIIRSTDVEGLDVITAGPSPPQSSHVAQLPNPW